MKPSDQVVEKWLDKIRELDALPEGIDRKPLGSRRSCSGCGRWRTIATTATTGTPSPSWFHVGMTRPRAVLPRSAPLDFALHP